MDKKMYETPSMEEIEIGTQTMLASSYPSDVDENTEIDNNGVYGD